MCLLVMSNLLICYKDNDTFENQQGGWEENWSIIPLDVIVAQLEAYCENISQYQPYFGSDQGGNHLLQPLKKYPFY